MYDIVTQKNTDKMIRRFFPGSNPNLKCIGQTQATHSKNLSFRNLGCEPLHLSGYLPFRYLTLTVL